MKRLVITLCMILIALIGYTQVTNVAEFRVANAATQFGVNLPVGSKVYDIANNKYYVATAGIVSTETLTTASASFSLLNDSGTDNQTAAQVSVSATGNISSTNVQAALEELQGDIDGIVITDDQTLSIDSTGRIFTLSIEDGNSVHFEDTNTQLTETDVDNFVSNNGYLTSEVDGSVTNEIQTLDVAQLNGTNLQLSLSSDGEATHQIDLSSLQDGDNQTATEVSIADAGGIITATDVEGALQENRAAIDSNTAKETNVTTDLSLGTVTATTVDINSSDGTNATITAATNSAAGVMTAAQVTKLEGITAGAEANLTMVTENFEANATPDYAFTLTNSANTSQGCFVSLNGAVLPSTSYTLAATSITIDNAKVTLYQYDKIVISYSY